MVDALAPAGLPNRDMLKELAKKMLDGAGYAIVKKSYYPPLSELDIAGDAPFHDLSQRCRDYTLTSAERMYALYKAVEYVVKHGIPGDVVECGVWKGGSMMLCALALRRLNETERRLFLYDTYEGMSDPTERDRDYGDRPAIESLAGPECSWAQVCCAPLEQVQANLYSTGYPKEHVLLVKGKVEDSIPEAAPARISILRLDTDWYESTYHELVHLFPRLSVGGVLILDDYGHWRGAKEAADQYFAQNRTKILLHRIDYTGRIGIKVE